MAFTAVGEFEFMLRREALVPDLVPVDMMSLIYQIEVVERNKRYSPVGIRYGYIVLSFQIRRKKGNLLLGEKRRPTGQNRSTMGSLMVFVYF